MGGKYRTKNREEALTHWPPCLNPNYRLKNRTNIRYNQCIAQWFSRRENENTYWVYLCDCGNYFEANANHVHKGNIKSCGCLRKEKAKENGKITGHLNGAKNGRVCAKDYTGQKFGELTFIEETSRRRSGNIIWKLRHENGRIFEATSWEVLSGHITGSQQSFGELQVMNTLKEMQINFIQQYKFKDCIDINSLPFDFYLPDYNCCIECDGEQHFKPVKHFGGEKRFDITQKHDQIKNQYCKNNNIKLIRIPYWDYSKININYIKERL